MNLYKVFLFLLLSFSLNQAFADVSLIFSYQDLENKILSQHPSIRNSQYDVDIAEDQQKQAEYSQYPRINFRVGGFPITPYLYMDKNNDFSVDWGQWQPSLQLQLNLDIPIYDFGRSKNVQLAAEYQKKAKQASVEIAKSDIILQVKDIYWGYLTYNTYKKYIFGVTMPEFEKLVKRKETKFNEGKITRNELEKSRIDYLDIKKSFAYLQRQKQSLDSQLGVLVDKSSMEDLNIEFKVKYLYELPLVINPYSYYLAYARENNPIFKKIENENLAAQFYAEYQKANIWPMIAFSFYTSYTFLEFTRPDDFLTDVYPDRGFKFGLGFTLNWSLNVWDHIVNYDLAQKNYLKLIEATKKANRQLERDLEESYNEMNFQNNQLNFQQEILTIAQRNFIFTNKAEGNGTASLDDVSDSLKNFLNKLENYYNQVRNFNLSVARFERLLGKNLIDYNQAEQKQIENEVLLDDDNGGIE